VLATAYWATSAQGGVTRQGLGLDPVSLSKVGTSLVASLVNKGKNRNPLLASEMPVPISP
jgi:hypothetical protein